MNIGMNRQLPPLNLMMINLVTWKQSMTALLFLMPQLMKKWAHQV